MNPNYLAPVTKSAKIIVVSKTVEIMLETKRARSASIRVIGRWAVSLKVKEIAHQWVHWMHALIMKSPTLSSTIWSRRLTTSSRIVTIWPVSRRRSLWIICWTIVVMVAVTILTQRWTNLEAPFQRQSWQTTKSCFRWPSKYSKTTSVRKTYWKIMQRWRKFYWGPILWPLVRRTKTLLDSH